MSTFPWGRAGLAAGTLFAIVGGVFLSRSAKDAPAEVVTVAPVTPVDVAPVAPSPIVAAPSGQRAASLASLGDLPWPPGERRSRSASSSQGGRMETGDSPLRNDAAEHFFAVALDACGPTRLIVGESVALVCENAREEVRAMIVPRPQRGSDDGTWLRTSRARFEAPNVPTAPATETPPNDVSRASCDWMMGYVALPPGARVSSTSGGDNRGHCSFDVDGDPARTFAKMVENLFRSKTVVHKRELIDGVFKRSVAEGWDEGWWRVDVVSAAPVHVARVTLTRWSPTDGGWMSPDDDSMTAPVLECGESCRNVPVTKEALQRCVFACEHKRGHPPAVIEKAH